MLRPCLLCVLCLSCRPGRAGHAGKFGKNQHKHLTVALVMSPQGALSLLYFIRSDVCLVHHK